MKKVGIKRGVVIAMNPQTGEVLALVSLPTYDNNQSSRAASATSDYAKLLNNPDKPLLNHAIQAHYPPGSTYKLVAGTGALADKKITPTRPGPHRGATSPLGATRFYDWNHTRLRGRATSTAASATRATRSSSRWRASSASIASATGPSSTASATRPGSTCPGEVSGIVPTNEWKQATLGAHDLRAARRTRRASARATTSSRRSSSSMPTRRWPTAARSTSRRSSATSSDPTAPSSGRSSRRSSTR
mgnify:CR=1 FL=1